MFSGFTLSVLVLLFAGCPGRGGGEPRTASATLSGDVEVPPAETNGTGEGTFTLNAAQTELAFEVTASGLTGPVMAAHFHHAPVGEAGQIVNDLTSLIEETNGQVTISGVWELEAHDVEDLLAGNIYVNLHTDANPAGELRAQVEFDTLEP